MKLAKHFIKSPITRKNPVSFLCNFYFTLTKYWGVLFVNFYFKKFSHKYHTQNDISGLSCKWSKPHVSLSYISVKRSL